MPRFLILMTEDDHYTRWEATGEPGQEKILTAFATFTAAVRTRGRFRGGEALVDPQATDTAAQLHGIYLIEVPDQETATELTALLPREYTIEIRECLEVGIPTD
jgi:hypothetical protein